MKKLLPIFLFVSSLAFAQGGARSGEIIKSSAGQSGTVRVCTGAATGTPCAPLANIYTDEALSIPADNPLTSDAYGNYQYFAAPGSYKEQIVSSAGTLTVPVSIGTTTSTSNTWTGSNTFQGAVVVPVPTLSTQAAQKAQVDAKADDSAVVHKSGDETIAGIKGFSSGLYASDLTGCNNSSTSKLLLDTNKKLVCGTDTTGVGTIYHICTIVLGGPDGTSTVLADTDDQSSFCVNQTGGAYTIDKVACQSDTGTPTVMLRKNGGANMLSGNLTCGTTWQTTTSFADATFPNNSSLDYLTVAAGGAAHRVTFSVVYH